MEGRTIYQMFLETVRAHGARRAVGFKEDKAEEITYWTYSELAERVRRFRRGLAGLGLKKGERLALISQHNRVEWAICDLAAQSLGVITVPIYGTLPAAQVSYYLRDSGARLLVVSDARQIAKVAEFRGEVPTLETVVAMEGEPEKLEMQNILPFEEVYRRGEAAGPDEAALDALAAAVKPEDIATLIYTSGTTGDPKGAMLTHANLLDTPDVVMEKTNIEITPDDIFLSFLPLSHITERVGGYYLPLRAGACIVYSQGLSAIANELTMTVRPTAMLCVPRLFENMAEKARERMAREPENRRSKAEWAVRVGTEIARRRSVGQEIGLALRLQHLVAERFILPTIREKITGGRLRYFVSGGAPLDPETAAFFLGIGVELLEGYGLSETSIIAVNRPGKERIGTVGNPLPGVELKFGEDGEILMRGPGRMQGYWNKPEATAEAIDAEGWFHTGDIGEMSPDGYLKITDRKKDIIVLSNGKKVAPQPIEGMLKHSPFIQEAVLFGDKQSTVMAILVPAFDKLLAWARSQELPANDVAALVASPEVQKLYRAEIDQTTAHLADFEKIRRFKLVSQPFDIETGELTPTLKVKRRFVAEKYADLLAAMSR